VADYPDDIAEALAGADHGHLSHLASPGGERVKVLETYAPVSFDGRPASGVFELYQDYAPVAAAAQSAFVPIAVALVLVLGLFYLSLIPVLRRVTRRMRAQMDRIEHQALHDELTGLAHRTLLRDRVDQALRAARRTAGGGAILLLDLDRFKEINDTLGHEAGDALLRELAVRLSAILRQSDTVARLGGDEFAVLAPDVGDAARALALAEKLREELSRPVVVSDLGLEVEASIGIARYPAHGTDVETLLRHADVALYIAKEAHVPTLYDAEHDHYSRARLTLVGELRRAIDEGQLVVHYQPKADMATGAIASVEALVRWAHPDHGLLSPDRFVPLAEHTGLIRPLTRWVLDTALAQCWAWERQGLDVGVSVNVSGRDLMDLHLPDEVAGLLARHGLEAGRLELEITENTILTDPVRARAVLERLSELGVGLAIDDFGTGHSSLGYLRRLPVDVLKIDKSFVLAMEEDESDAAIVRSAIDLAHNLGLSVVAEGVESESVWTTLAGLGCDTAQGYLLGRPAEAPALTPTLARGERV